MLSDQTFYPPFVVAFNHELFFDPDSPMELNLTRIGRFKNLIQTLGNYSFFYFDVCGQDDMDKIAALTDVYLNLNSLGVQVKNCEIFDFDTPRSIAEFSSKIRAFDVVYAPEIRKDKRVSSKENMLDCEPDVFLAALEYFLDVAEPLSFNSVRKQILQRTEKQ